MIKLHGRTGRGTPLLVLGLTGENVTRLHAGKPILIHAAELEEMGLPPLVIAIHYGSTDQALLAEIRSYINVREAAGPGGH